MKRTGDKNFEVSVASKNPREFEVRGCVYRVICIITVASQLLTKPTDFEMSDSLKLLLQGDQGCGRLECVMCCS